MAAARSAPPPPPASCRRRRLALSSSLLFGLLALVILLSVCAAAASSSPPTCSKGARRRLASAQGAQGEGNPLAARDRKHHRRRLHAAPHPRRRSLLQGPNTKTASANGAGYTLIGTAPIAITHTHLLPGTRDKMLAINYFDASGSYPDGADADGRTISRVFDRASFSFDVVPIGSNAVCGAWTSLPDGKIGMFAGHVPMGVQPEGFNDLYVYNPFDGRWGGIEDRGGLSQGRWYPGVCALPDGRALIYGGSAANDFEGRATDGDLFSYASNDVVRTPQMPAFFADVAYGPYYPLLVSLPNGGGNDNDAAVLMALNSRAGVVVPETGELLAQAPPFPEPYANLVFEYPMSGSLAMLRSDPRLASFGAPGGSNEARVVIVVTGGVLGADWYREYKLCDDRENYLKTCSDGVLTIGLTMTATNGGGVAFAFDNEWTATAMPAGRCVHDVVLLPNNKALIINGVEKGYAGLGDCQLAHDPHAEPVLFNPATNEATATGHLTNVPRLYHGMAALTARGDVLISGTTNTKGWTNTQNKPLQESPWGSEYRVEIYTPASIGNGQKRPLIARSPTTALFGSSFLIETDDPISAIVLMHPGGATHGMALNQRAQDLAFEAEGNGVYRVQAPASPQNAPPGHYLLFALANDGDTYSEGSWLLLRASMDEPLGTLPVGSVKVTQASTGFEEEGGEQAFACGAPCRLRNGVASSGTGNQGAHLMATGNAWSDVLLASGNIDSGDLADLAAGGGSEGSYAYVFFWARGGGELTVAFADVAAVAAGATETNQAVVPGTRTTAYLTGDGEWRLYALQPVFLPRNAGQVRLVIGGTEADIDDVETWASGSSTVVNAAFRSALRSVQQKVGSMRADGGEDVMAMAAMHHGGAEGGARRNERFLSAKARAFGVYA